MARREPLRRADELMLTGYWALMAVVFAWIVAAGIALEHPPDDEPWLDWVTRRGPVWLAVLQSVFFLVAADRRAFRQRLMSTEAKPQDALAAAGILWVSVLIYLVILVD